MFPSSSTYPRLILAFFLLIACAFIRPASLSTKKILFVCTSVDKVNGTKNGTYLVEIAAPIFLLTQAGFEVDIVSPLGGKIPIYHKGDTSAFLKKATQLPTFKNKIHTALTPAQVNITDYKAVIIPGGYGQFSDLHQHAPILKLIAGIYQQGGVLGTIGHGTSTLCYVKLPNGEYLVKNKTMTCFPSWFEQKYMAESQFGKHLPIDMEKMLRHLGANLQAVDTSYSNKTITDQPNRLVTAAFANDADYVANEVIKLLQH